MGAAGGRPVAGGVAGGLLAAHTLGQAPAMGAAQRLPRNGGGPAAASERDFVAAPAIHVYGGPAGAVTAERSAGYEQWEDGATGYTQRNLVAKLFVNQPVVANRLIRLGSLYSPLSREGGTSAVGVGAPGAGAPPGDDRTPAQRERDKVFYGHSVAIANHAAAFRLNYANTRAVVQQALHLPETNQRDGVAAVASVIGNNWQKHTDSATNSGKKQTMTTYRPCVARFCAWAEEKDGTDTLIIPMNRNTVVPFLEAEKERRRVTGKRRRTADGSDEEVTDGDDATVPAPLDPHPPPVAASGALLPDIQAVPATPARPAGRAAGAALARTDGTGGTPAA